MLLQIKELPGHWHLSRWDGLVWGITFFVTLFVQISIGLAAGVAASLVSVAAQGLTPRASILGRLAGTDLYLELKRHKAVNMTTVSFCSSASFKSLQTEEVPGLKIIHFVGGLSFASRDSFKELFVQKVGFDPTAILRKLVKLREKVGFVKVHKSITIYSA